MRYRRLPRADHSAYLALVVWITAACSGCGTSKPTFFALHAYGVALVYPCLRHPKGVVPIFPIVRRPCAVSARPSPHLRKEEQARANAVIV
jgi:hypothetical protein